MVVHCICVIYDVDLSKAFDLVDRSLLFRKLLSECYNTGIVHSLSEFSGERCYVRPFNVCNDVRQGSVLSTSKCNKEVCYLMYLLMT